MEKYNVDFSPSTCGKIGDAICTIRTGLCKRVDINKDVKVYDCGGVIRIDLKKREDKVDG